MTFPSDRNSSKMERRCAERRLEGCDGREKRVKVGLISEARLQDEPTFDMVDHAADDTNYLPVLLHELLFSVPFLASTERFV